MPDVPHGGFGDRHRLDRAAEADLVADLGTMELPRVAECEPVFGIFLLPAVLHDLAEQAVLVADAVAVGGYVERRHALHEAGGEAAEAAIAQRRVGFEGAQLVQIDVEAGQRGAHRVELVQVVEVVEQQPPDQEFERQVIDPLGAVLVRGIDACQPAVDDAVAQRDKRSP